MYFIMLRVQELGELADECDLNELEDHMRDVLKSMVILAEKGQFDEIKRIHNEFQNYRVLYCKKTGKREDLTDNWDMARNKVITYWNYIICDYVPESKLLQDALKLAGAA
jgi:hypothetical protein